MLAKASAVCLVLAVLFSTATQLRFAAFGMGEVFGAFGIVGALISVRVVPKAAGWFLGGVCVIAAGMILGLLANVLFVHQPFRVFDFLGMFYAQLVAWAILAVSNRLRQGDAVVLPALVALPLIQLMLVILSLFGVSPLSIWYGGEEGADAAIPFLSRLMGWSVNPNQLGIALSALPFWLLYFRSRLVSVRPRTAMLTSIAVFATVCCGLLVRSNTVFLAWIFGSAALFVTAFRWKWSTVSFTLPILFLGIVAILFLANDLFPTLLEKGDASDLNGRLPLWISSLESWSRSPLVGLGPGPHAYNGLGGAAESHMLLLDMLTQGGVLAAGGLLYLFWIAFRTAFQTRFALVIAATVAVFVETLAHNAQRHPIFWLYLTLPLLIHLIGHANQVVARRRIESNP